MGSKGLNLISGMTNTSGGGGGGGGSQETIVEVATATMTQNVADNTIYNAGELTDLTFTLPSTVGHGFLCQLNFTSGTTATQLTAPVGIAWDGDDIDGNGVFVPATSTRYVVMLYSDGVMVRGIVNGVAVTINP